jgi:hypothetical protein
MLALPIAARAMGHGHGKPQPIPCPADVATAIATQCPCDAARNHGQFVKCVVHFRNSLRKSGCLTDVERHTIARCAARSTCGKSSVLCCHYDSGTCNDPMPGDGIKAGACSNDTSVTCDVSSDCTTSTASLRSDAGTCMADGGVVVDGGGSVCDPCPPPPTTTTSTSTTTTTVP